MKKRIDGESLENLITNILFDIDNSLRAKISDYKLDLSTLTSEEKKLKYIDDEKSNIRKSLKETVYKTRATIDKYAEYLSKKPLKTSLRRAAIDNFIYTSIVLYDKNESTINFMNSYDYKRQRKLDIINSLVKRASLLEFNSFLSDEINKIEQKDFKKIDSDNNKLNWLGTPTELIELCKALVVNKSIKGTQKEIIRNFSGVLNVDIKDPKSPLQRLVKRYDKTIFLDKLTSNLKEFETEFEANLFLSDEIEQKDFKKTDSDNNKLNWLGTPIELIELCVALFVNKSIKETQKDIIRNFIIFLNVDLKDLKETLQCLANRSEKTMFLDKLTSNLKAFYYENLA
ncbi:RteC domain-containing protein [Tenacibaculum soleae]|uniref:RteC domain-containing protein n=1 Tax=Tenacibaculum soleae TaxID=447689 RepID=UPI0026E3330A|nr:RteC domain-containing protein [Tenacibaculum soleae]MDO6813248.1 RteC domain-containing protein [Tenacibaculum soleae]